MNENLFQNTSSKTPGVAALVSRVQVRPLENAKQNILDLGGMTKKFSFSVKLIESFTRPVALLIGNRRVTEVVSRSVHVLMFIDQFPVFLIFLI